jgi:hypothetical protein
VYFDVWGGCVAFHYMCSPTIQKPILKWIAQKAYPQRSSERIGYLTILTCQERVRLFCFAMKTLAILRRRLQKLPVVLMRAG